MNRNHAYAERRFKAVENDRLQDKGFLHRTVVVGPITVYIYYIRTIYIHCYACACIYMCP